MVQQTGRSTASRPCPTSAGVFGAAVFPLYTVQTPRGPHPPSSPPKCLQCVPSLGCQQMLGSKAMSDSRCDHLPW